MVCFTCSHESQIWRLTIYSGDPMGSLVLSSLLCWFHEGQICILTIYSWDPIGGLMLSCLFTHVKYNSNVFVPTNLIFSHDLHIYMYILAIIGSLYYYSWETPCKWNKNHSEKWQLSIVSDVITLHLMTYVPLDNVLVCIVLRHIKALFMVKARSHNKAKLAATSIFHIQCRNYFK